MARSLSIVRRRTNLIDLTIQARPGVGSYRFFSTTNFDIASVLFETVPAFGKASLTVVNNGYGKVIDYQKGINVSVKFPVGVAYIFPESVVFHTAKPAY